MWITYYNTSFVLSILCFLSYLGTVNPQRMDAAAFHWHLSLYPIPGNDDFSREEESGEHRDDSVGVMGGNVKWWRSRLTDQGGCNERSWKESKEGKECELDKEF